VARVTFAIGGAIGSTKATEANVKCLDVVFFRTAGGRAASVP